MVTKQLLLRPDLLHYDYKLVPYAIDTVKLIKDLLGLKVAVCSNSNTPLKRIKVLESLIEPLKVDDLFDAFIISGDVGVRKPNPEILKLVLSRFPDVRPHEAFIVGDQIDRDVACAHDSGIRSVYFGVAPYNREANYKALGHGCIPDFSILDLR